jgi:hypothetical protein
MLLARDGLIEMKKVEDYDNMKSAESFVAQQIVTDDEKEVLKNWGTSSQGVYFPTSDEIERKKSFQRLLFSVAAPSMQTATAICDRKFEFSNQMGPFIQTYHKRKFGREHRGLRVRA